MSSKRYNEAKKIIESSAEHFLERIRSISEIGPSKKIRRNIPSFALLGPGNKEYFEYEYYAVSLEWYIRDYLINETLQKLFELYGVHAEWPDTGRKVYVRYRNESIEERIPFEFIILQKDNNIGYRYTSIGEDECCSFRKEYNLSKIYVIDWKTEATCKEYQQEGKGLQNITAKTFFTNIFSESIYELFMKIARSSVEKANQDIGFQTIPRFSLRYLSCVKDELELSLCEKDYSKLRYKTLDSSEKEYYEGMSFSVSDYALLDSNFKGEKLYRALTGTKGFAKCFLTAEYLYYIFKDGNYFDYTSVVSGYLKSVEQLIYEILDVNLLFVHESDNYWIKRGNKKIKWKAEKRNHMLRSNPVTNKPQIRFLPQNKKYFDTTMVPMIWFLYDNDRYLVSADGRDTIHELLLRYSQECRNEHFHKENIEIFNEVKAIRNNTYLILYCLLGGCKLLDRKESKKELGIIDKRYEQLYKRMIEISKSVRKFYIKFEGQEEKLAYRLIDQEKPKYDLYGFLVLSDIKFVSEKNYTDIENEGEMVPDIIIDRNNIPEKIWFVKYGGERVPISF